MRSGHKHDDSGQEGVERQANQTEPINHHRSKLPVRGDDLILILLPQPLGQIPQFSQDHLHLLHSEDQYSFLMGNGWNL